MNSCDNAADICPSAASLPAWIKSDCVCRTVDLGCAALVDLGFELAVHLRQVGRALLDPAFELLLRRALQLQPFGQPSPPLQHDRADKTRRGRSAASRLRRW